MAYRGKGTSPEEVAELQAELRCKEVQNKFRILSDWNIDYVVDAEYKGQASVSGVANLGTIYGWPTEQEEPDDFLLHEMLHMAIKALIRTPEDKEQEAEEGLVQDICKIWRERNATRRG